MKKILVVDDSAFVRNFHINILKSDNYLSEGVCNGVEALEKTLFNEYDLILCDINMSIMDGLSFIKEFRQSGKETPIIIISTLQELKNKSIGFQAGANLYITKPVTPEAL